MQPDTNITEYGIKQRSKRSGYNLQNFFVIFIGFCSLALGLFMVTGMYALQVFNYWLPLTLLLTGVILLSSKNYSIWLGVLLLAISGFIWLHGYGLTHFAAVTHFIDWSFVLIGMIIIVIDMVRIFIHRTWSV